MTVMNTEIVSVVDENDIVIATKPRSELTQTDIVRVSVLWLENGRGEVLLQQRSFTKKADPGLWGPAVAGTVEAHETYLANIIKESEEEIGLTDFTPIEVGKRLRAESDGHYGRMFTFYKAIVDKDISEFKIAEDEVESIAWFDKAWVVSDVKNNPRAYVPSAIFWEEMYY
jgi:isopentenyldiphosphate isomerase